MYFVCILPVAFDYWLIHIVLTHQRVKWNL